MVWFSLRVREATGSIPVWAQLHFGLTSTINLLTKSLFARSVLHFLLHGNKCLNSIWSQSLAQSRPQGPPRISPTNDPGAGWKNLQESCRRPRSGNEVSYFQRVNMETSQRCIRLCWNVCSIRQLSHVWHTHRLRLQVRSCLSRSQKVSKSREAAISEVTAKRRGKKRET